MKTPETDAQIIWFGGWEDNRHVPANFARKLEIERNEARAGRQAYKQLAVKHAQERDEARTLAEERKGYWDSSEKHYEEIRGLYQKEIRRNAKLRDIAERAIEMKEQEVWGTGELPFSWKQLRDQLKEGEK